MMNKEVNIIGMSKAVAEHLEEQKQWEHTESVTGGAKDTKGKPRINLVPTEIITAIADSFSVAVDMGKYPKNNWRKGIDYTLLYDAALRHMFKWVDGADIDEETGTHHVVSALTNLCMLYYTVCKVDEGKLPESLDDRFKE